MNGKRQELFERTDRETASGITVPIRLWRENINIVRRIIVAVVGTTVLLLGVALLVLPGPAFIVIPIGLAILATEFAWARHWLKKVRRIATRIIPGSAR